MGEIVHADLGIPEGITVITGPSGSGKTTLLRLMCAMQAPTSGTIRYRSQALDEIDPVNLRRRVTMVTQAPFLWPGTIAEGLNAARTFQGVPPASANDLHAAMDVVGLRHNPASDSHTLSGGERQRLALARVLLAGPEVYLLDEPTAALDEGGARELVTAVIHHLRDLGAHIVMVTHDQALTDVADTHVHVDHHLAKVVT